MAALTVTDIVIAGITPSLVAAAGGGDTFVNQDGDVFFYALNGDASPTTITFTTPAQLGGPLTIEDPSDSLAAGAIGIYGPFNPAHFNAADGTGVAVTYSSVVSLTVGAFRLKRYY